MSKFHCLILEIKNAKIKGFKKKNMAEGMRRNVQNFIKNGDPLIRRENQKEGPQFFEQLKDLNLGACPFSSTPERGSFAKQIGYLERHSNEFKKPKWLEAVEKVLEEKDNLPHCKIQILPTRKNEDFERRGIEAVIIIEPKSKNSPLNLPRVELTLNVVRSDNYLAELKDGTGRKVNLTISEKMLKENPPQEIIWLISQAYRWAAKNPSSYESKSFMCEYAKDRLKEDSRGSVVDTFDGTRINDGVIRRRKNPSAREVQA